MTTSKKVFIASDVFSAFIDRGNPKYDYTVKLYRFFAEQEFLLFTDVATLNKVYDQISRDISPSLSREFLRTITQSNINLLYPDESDMKAAYKTILTYQSSDLTFGEAIMAVLANRRSIPQIATYSYLHPLFGLTLFYLPT